MRSSENPELVSSTMMATSGMKLMPSVRRMYRNFGSSRRGTPRRPSFFASKCTPAKMPKK